MVSGDAAFNLVFGFRILALTILHKNSLRYDY